MKNHTLKRRKIKTVSPKKYRTQKQILGGGAQSIKSNMQELSVDLLKQKSMNPNILPGKGKYKWQPIKYVFSVDKLPSTDDMKYITTFTPTGTLVIKTLTDSGFDIKSTTRKDNWLNSYMPGTKIFDAPDAKSLVYYYIEGNAVTNGKKYVYEMQICDKLVNGKYMLSNGCMTDGKNWLLS